MTQILQSMLLAATPLIFGAVAGIIAERTGVLNIALEGLMLAGAFGAGWAGAEYSPFTGFLVALAFGLFCGLVLGWIMVLLRGDQVVVGIAFNIFILGVTSYAYQAINGTRFNAFSVKATTPFAIPGLSDLPGVGVLFDQHWLVYVAYLLVPVVSVVIFRTGLGVRMRACGEFAEGALASGVKVARARILAMGVSGMIAAAGGAYLVLGDLRAFRQDATAGVGYIALAVVILGRWGPTGAGFAALGFGLAEALGYYAQARGTGIPPELLFALPYIVGLIAVGMFGRRVQPPAEEGKPLALTK